MGMFVKTELRCDYAGPKGGQCRAKVTGVVEVTSDDHANFRLKVERPPEGWRLIHNAPYASGFTLYCPKHRDSMLHL